MKRNQRHQRALRFENLETRELFSVGAGTLQPVETGAAELREAAVQVADANLVEAAATKLAFGEIVTGRIEKREDVDKFRFKVTAGTVVQLAVTGTNAKGFVASADVVDKDGTRLFTVNAGQHMNWKFNEGGTYRIRVHDQKLTKRGDYTLGLERLSAPFSEDRQPIGFGAIVGGTINDPIQRNQHTFTVTGPTKVQLAVTGTNPNGFVAWADVWDVNGNKVFSVKAGGWREYDLQEGSYVIQVQDQYLTKAGSYTLGLERLSAPFSEDRQPIGFGAIAGGTIGQAIERDQYTFTVTGPTKIQLAVTGTNPNGFVAWADVWNVNGNKVFSVKAGEWREYDLQEGSYVIQVQDQNLSKAGSYTLGLERLSGPFSDDKKSIHFGSRQSDEISKPIQRNQYTFTVTSRTKVRLAVTGTNPNGFVAWADVRGLDGKRVFSTKAGQSQEYELIAGTYMIQVQDQDLRDAGRYTLALDKI